MLKRWDTRNYDIKLILKAYDTLDIDLKAINAPIPKIFDLDTIIKALILKEFEGLSLRSAEIRIEELLGTRIDHLVLHFWEKSLSNAIEGIMNMILESLTPIEYSTSFIDSTIFTNKKE